MIKLTVADTNGYHEDAKFYFHNMDDCNSFMELFKDHWCNVPWNKPEIIPDDTYIGDSKRFLDRDPKERAVSNLSWGFALVRYRGIEDTEKQKAFVSSLVQRLS